MTSDLTPYMFLVALAAPPLTVVVGILLFLFMPSERDHGRATVSVTKRSHAA